MANQIKLEQQSFSLKEIIKDMPEGKFKKKIFFQTELQSLANGDASFGIIAYAAYLKDKQWIVGKKVSCSESKPVEPIPLSGYLGFANNELLLSLPGSVVAP